MHPIIVFPSHDTKNYLKKFNTAVLFQLMIQLQNKEGISLTAVHQYLLQLQTPIIIRMPCITKWLGDVNVSDMNETLTHLCFQVTITEMWLSFTRTPKILPFPVYNTWGK